MYLLNIVRSWSATSHVKYLLKIVTIGSFFFCGCVSANIFSETFSENASSSWGRSWNTLSRADRASIDDGVGVITHKEPGSVIVEFGKFKDVTNVEISGQIHFETVPESGYIDASLYARQYYFRIRHSDSSLRLVIEHRSDGIVDKIVNKKLYLDPESRRYYLRAIVTGSDTVRIAAQVWQEGQIPPAGWLVDMTDDSFLTKARSGTAGVKSTHGSETNGGSVVTFDNYTLSTCTDYLCGLPPRAAILSLKLYKCPVNTDIRGTGHPFWNSYGCVGQITDQSRCTTMRFVRDVYTPHEYDCEPL